MDFFAEVEKICFFHLIQEPIPLSGGFLHRMYRLQTDRGDFALKRLNGAIMKRSAAMGNFARAEGLESVLEARGLPILPALRLNGQKMQRAGGEYFYLFDYYAGKSLRQNEVTPRHCERVGGALAAIHAIDKRGEARDSAPISIDWELYLEKTKRAGMEIHLMLAECLPLIQKSQEMGNRARKRLPPLSAICHNDMDCKNVLWAGDDFRIIDLECLDYSQPQMELFELALCWAGYEESRLDFSLFRAFLRGYAAGGGEAPKDWETLYSCNIGRLEWLEYNVKRALGLEGALEEKEMGIRQVKQTLAQIRFYDGIREELLAQCAQISW